ncbi:response regulator [Sphingobium sp. YBL2]|uniref:response regulator n=1 Tax=Sphingobium sp. (strain YBL2) TaxID=484429 RepID=UPI0005CBF640|nr:response regulator [Sphingobium sp. YBL2]AJR23044.1 hypothetical protein TZ53_03960 [Sphingobium sp. YBL2]
MRLEFKVLWFENQMDGVQQAVAGMRRELAKHGMLLELDQQGDASRLDELSAHQEKFHDYDLVVVDWDLGEGQPKGDEVAERIRNSFGFTDIIFYSGKATDQLRDMVKDRAIDGVYCAPRNGLRNKLIEHVNHVVERLSRLEAMRGLAVVSAGRADEQMREVVRLAHGKMDAEAQSELVAAIDTKVAGAANSHAKAYGKLKDLEGRLASRALNSGILHEVATLSVQKVVATHPACEPHLAILGTYVEEVIQPRNALGHIVETRDVDGWVINYASGKRLDKAGLSKMRKDLSRHLDNFAAISAVLSEAAEGK